MLFGEVVVKLSDTIISLSSQRIPKTAQTIDPHTNACGDITHSNTRIITLDRGTKKKKLHSPVLFTAFPGPGLLGSICANYIISELDMLLTAYIESSFILPGVIYNEEGLRYPFSLYSDTKGLVCVLVCEVPVMIQGMNSILDTIMEWALTNKVQEIIVLDGIPVEGLSISRREPLIFSEKDGKLDRQSILRVQGDPLTKTKQKEKKVEVSTAHNPKSVLTGMSGGVLSGCILNNIPSKALIISTPKGFPDFEGAAILIESLGQLTDKKHLKLDTKQLRETAATYKTKILANQDMAPWINTWIGSLSIYDQAQFKL